MLSVNEKSPLFMTMNFKDELDAPLVPSTVEWRLDDKTNGVEIVPWTNLPGPADTMTMVIPGDNNVIDDADHIQELHAFGLRLDDGLAGEAYQELLYNVLNLIGPSGA